MAASSLTAEQLKRIERNRAEAIRRMVLRQQREKELGDIENISVGANNYSTIDISNVSSRKEQTMLPPELGSLNSSNKVSVAVRDENKGPIQQLVAKSNDGSKSFLQSSPTKYVITYREEQQPSTSALLIPSKAKVDHKRLSLLSPIKQPTTVHPKQGVVNIIFKLIDSKSFQVGYTLTTKFFYFAAIQLLIGSVQRYSEKLEVSLSKSVKK